MTEAGPPEPNHAPPRARLTYRVGAVGHRPKRLASGLSELAVLNAQVRDALSAVRDEVETFAKGPDRVFYTPDAPRLVAVTSLAEGADRIVAGAALDLNFELICPTPFAQEVFVRDFEPPVTLEPDSTAHFAALMARARSGAGLTTFELDGEYGPRTLAYARCARVVVSQSDLLVAIWDGAPAAGPGGTPDSVREALVAGVPVLWIDAQAPFGWRLLRRPDEVEPLSRQAPCARPPPPSKTGAHDLSCLLCEVIANELAPPHAGGGQLDAHMREDIRRYQAETRPPLNLAFIWKLFRDMVGSFKLRRPQFRTSDYVEQIASDWPVGTGNTPHDRINAGVRPHYAWADKTADHYADLHRSAFVLTSILTPLAVFAALAPIAFPPWRTGVCAATLMGVEFVLVVVLLGLLRGERKGEWHKRWMEYRVLAEQLRQLRLVTPVGGGRPRSRPRPHLSNYGDPTQSWMSWTVRAIAREIGLPNVVVSPDYVGSCLTDLYVLADGQLQFHEASAARSETIHLRLHHWSIFLLWLTVAGVLLHIFTIAVRPTEAYAPYAEGALVMIAAVCPALGAAFASINNQGEFQRMAKRSEAMSAFFAAHRDAIRALRAAPTPPRMEQVEPLARQIAEAMVDEVSDWRIVMNDRALGV